MALPYWARTFVDELYTWGDCCGAAGIDPVRSESGRARNQGAALACFRVIYRMRYLEILFRDFSDLKKELKRDHFMVQVTVDKESMVRIIEEYLANTQPEVAPWS